MLRIYYNSECSKSRAALARLEAAGLTPEVVDYLTDPPQRAQLEGLINKLDAPAVQLLRRRPEHGAPRGADVVDALLVSPELLQRPIVEDATRAIVARPPERLDPFLNIGNQAS